MGSHRFARAALAALALVSAPPALANPATERAELVRRLDIMLMVTGLRCRTGADDFRAEYGRLTTRHLGELNAAAAQMRTDLARRLGPTGAERALDRLSVTMANAYGQGHPWLGCAELKQAVAGLANMQGADLLHEAAGQLLAPTGNRAQLALARR